MYIPLESFNPLADMFCWQLKYISLAMTGTNMPISATQIEPSKLFIDFTQEMELLFPAQRGYGNYG